MAESVNPQRHLDGQAAVALKTVTAALQEEKGAEAVRALMQLLPTGLIPGDSQMVPWLAGILGRPLLVKLVNAFVLFPCFYCEAGRVKCEGCQGRRNSSEPGRLCESCLGMGHERCDFCAGSGWVTINDVPDGLKRPVIKGRATLAARRVERLLSQQLPDLSSSEPSQSIDRLQTLILELDRHMGVFENMLIATRHLPAPEDAGEGSLQQLIRKCVSLGAKAEVRICELIRLIAKAYRLEGQKAGAGLRVRECEATARFYESLVDPDRTLTGTGLEHPFLHEAARQSRSRPA